MKKIFLGVAIVIALTTIASSQPTTGQSGPGPVPAPCGSFGTTIGTCAQSASASVFTIAGLTNSSTVTNATSSPLYVGDGFAKTDTTERAVAALQSNDASNPFGLVSYIRGGASDGSRYVKLQTASFGSANAGSILLQPDGGLLGIGLGNATIPTTGFDVGLNSRFTGTVTMTGLGTDAAATDSSICLITSTKAVVTGTGTLGICLGTSSARYKKNMRPIDIPALPKVLGLIPTSYHYKSGYGDGGARKDFWLIAEEAEKVMPECVPLDGGGGPMSVDPICVQAFMLKAMKEQQSQINALSARNVRLARQVEAIKLQAR